VGDDVVEGYRTVLLYPAVAPHRIDPFSSPISLAQGASKRKQRLMSSHQGRLSLNPEVGTAFVLPLKADNASAVGSGLGSEVDSVIVTSSVASAI
jgi:hypothetical protein